jgi:alkylation response protein AidB-like acyl-CoA dehydrogenase
MTVAAARRRSETSPEDEAEILGTIDRWLDRDVRPHVQALEHDDIYPAEMVSQMKELGLFGASIGEEYGGLGLSATTYARIVQRVSEVWMSLSGIFNSHLIMAACIERNGTEEQKRRFLPRLATGELRGGLALTEPDCGTDLQAIRTRAVREGNSAYVFNGTKTWISNGIHGQVFAVLVKTDPQAEPRHRGMSLFIAEKGPGFRASRKLEKLGYKGIDSAELIFEDHRVPAENLIGEEGRGLQVALGGLELGRINVAARGCGIAKAALDESVRYAQLRKTFGKPIAQHQAIQLKLAEMATRTEAAIALTYNAARAYDEGRRCDMEAGMAKYLASEAAIENSLEAMRIHGAYGYSKEFNVERYYRDAPLLVIGEGTNELQKIIIARQLIERNPA